jgi:hypothetical protein
MRCKLVEVSVSHIEFQQNLWNGIWNIWKSQFMDLRKLGLIWINVTENQKFQTTFGGNLSYRISTNPVKLFTGYGKLLWSYANYASLWINTVENHNCPAPLNESFKYRISVCAKPFMRYKKTSISDLT